MSTSIQKCLMVISSRKVDQQFIEFDCDDDNKTLYTTISTASTVKQGNVSLKRRKMVTNNEPRKFIEELMRDNSMSADTVSISLEIGFFTQLIRGFLAADNVTITITDAEIIEIGRDYVQSRTLVVADGEEVSRLTSSEDNASVEVQASVDYSGSGYQVAGTYSTEFR